MQYSKTYNVGHSWELLERLCTFLNFTFSFTLLTLNSFCCIFRTVVFRKIRFLSIVWCKFLLKTRFEMTAMYADAPSGLLPGARAFTCTLPYP